MSSAPSTPPIHNADSRPWRNAWKALVHLISNDVNPINYAVRTKKRAILAANARLIELESIVINLAQSSPVNQTSEFGECKYCGVGMGYKHTSTCIWKLAKDAQKESHD